MKSHLRFVASGFFICTYDKFVRHKIVCFRPNSGEPHTIAAPEHPILRLDSEKGLVGTASPEVHFMGRPKAGSGRGVAKDTSGTFVKNLGWKGGPEAYKQHRFYLGKNEAEAAVRALRLDQVWAVVERRWQANPETPRPVWDEVLLTIAQAVSRGESTCTLDIIPDGVPDPEAMPGEPAYEIDTNDPAATVYWLRELQQDVPFVRLVLADEEAEQQGSQFWDAEGPRLIERGNKLLKRNSRQTLFQALDAFHAAQRQRYSDHTGKLSLTGQVALKDVQRIKDHCHDMPLGEFDLQAIEAVIEHWQKRPATKTKARYGQPVKPKTVKNTIKRFRMFLKWLHRSKDFAWRKPEDYEVTPIVVKMTPGELAARVSADQVQTYSVDQLGVLFKYAKPRERVWMLLALNCGFGIAELATLQTGEAFRNHLHPKFKSVGNYLKRIRSKNHVYGEWELWDITLKGIDWSLSERPETAVQNVFVTGAGTPIADQTSGGNRAMVVPNAWNSLTKRVRNDDPTFPALSFNKLRKTAINAVRDIADGEVAGIFASHGQAVMSDALLELYANRPFDKVFEACRVWGDKLSAVFGVVTNPFVAMKRRHKKSDKFLAEQERVVSLREQGHTLRAISDTTNISLRMVRHYLACNQTDATTRRK